MHVEPSAGDHPEGTTAAWFIWPAIADIMVCLLGIFVLLFVWSLVLQIELEAALRQEKEARLAEAKRLRVLEKALAKPLAEGRMTLVEGRIGMQGSVLFTLGSAELSAEGLQLIANVAQPLSEYVRHAGANVMVSGFTDNKPLRGNSGGFRDNWELSTERALTVMRALIDAGFPRDQVFAAGFGENNPVVANDSDAQRALNRRVEIAPVPMAKRLARE